MVSLLSTVTDLTPLEIKTEVPYHYIPTEWICALFVALFSVTGVIHVVELVMFRMWWLLPTVVLASIAEIIGWAGRLWSSQNPTLLTPFLMQITTTIIAPTPLVAANFVILGRVIQRLGPQYSRLGPGLYTIIFCCCDIVALVVQAVGGASASTAAQQHRNADDGGHIMLGGIAFQLDLAAICVYVACASEFLICYKLDRPIRKVATRPKQGSTATLGENPRATRGSMDRRLSLMIFGLALSTILIFIRSVYRTIELSNGWSGRIISTQVYFNVLDGAMIVLASFTLNFLHPGFLLPNTNPTNLDDAQYDKDREESYGSTA